MTPKPFAIHTRYRTELPLRPGDRSYRFTRNRYFVTTAGCEAHLLRAIEEDFNVIRLSEKTHSSHSYKLVAMIYPWNNQHPRESISWMDWGAITRLLSSDRVQVRLQEKYA